MRNTNLTGYNAETALTYMRQQGIGMVAKLERELEKGSKTSEYVRDKTVAPSVSVHEYA